MMSALGYHKREADSKKTVLFFYTHSGMEHLTLDDLKVGIREASL